MRATFTFLGYFDNLDEAKGCTDMPMTHYIRGQEQTNAPDQRYSIYSSNPDLLRGGVSHRRYSSTDSMDGSHCSGQSGHSQQGSDSREIIYPTRRYGYLPDRHVTQHVIMVTQYVHIVNTTQVCLHSMYVYGYTLYSM